MPQIYRPVATTSQPRPTESDISDDSASDSQADPDEALFLSDLVRTGEASRLRRRGAVRLDHAPYHRQSLLPQTPALIVVDTSTTSVSEEEEDADARQSRQFVGGRGVETMEPFARREAQLAELRKDDHHPTMQYTLFCGGYDDSAIYYDTDAQTPFESSPLPQMPSSAHGKRRRSRPTNGCGALVHLHAAPRSSPGAWTAPGDATDAVVAMDPGDRKQQGSCGCVREAIGCVVCGNLLGSRFRPCNLFERSILGSRHRHAEPSCPSGARYWRPCAYSSWLKNQSYDVYTFSTTAVSSNPPYVFQSHRPRPSSIRSRYYSSQSDLTTVDDSRTNTPDYIDMVLGRGFTDSPTPLSDAGDENEESYPVRLVGGEAWGSNRPDEPASVGPVFNADGELITGDEPSSPDKTHELMLFPER
ncbi:hypothetical protein HGRIS_013771 [Hohenbuehelia grisea]|uniref:Uncharacterized protein n=1 Tax=Hohenbuehelia grisea TaxID=104357 RepID=A0ABR3IWQ6_9AGAR